MSSIALFDGKRTLAWLGRQPTLTACGRKPAREANRAVLAHAGRSVGGLAKLGQARGTRVIITASMASATLAASG